MARTSSASRTLDLVRAAATGRSIPHVPSVMGIAIDSREQRPQLHASIPWVVCALPAGDYAPIGYESEIAVERKSLADLFGSTTRDNARFQRELEKLSTYRFAAVVIEGTQRDVLRGVRYSQIPGGRVLSTCATLEVKHGVAFHFAGDRPGATLWTFELLEAAWRRAEAEKRQQAIKVLEAGLRAEVRP